MTTDLYTTTDGIDVAIQLHPDTPAEWDRIPRGALRHLDRLASTLAGAGPDWIVQITYGDIREGTTDLVATPATDERQAA